MWGKWGLKGPLFIIGIAILLVVCILYIGSLSFQATEDAVNHEFNQRQLVLAKGATSGIELYFETLADDMNALGAIQEVQQFDETSTRQEIQHTFDKLEHLGVNDIGVLDADGVLRYNVMAPHIEGVDFSWRQYFKDLKDTTSGDTYVIEFIDFKGVDVGKKGVLLAVPMIENGEFAGVVLCTIKLDTVTQRFVEPIKPSQGGHAFLIDDKSTVLSSPDKTFFGRNLLVEVVFFPTFQEILGEMVAGGSGTSEYSYYIFEDTTAMFTGEKEEILIAYTPVFVGNNIWSIGVWAPKEDSLRLMRSSAINIVVLVASSILIIILGTSYSLYSYSNTNKQLQKAHDELDLKVEQRTSELKKSEEKWKSLTEDSPDHIMLLDLEGNILFINHTVPDLTVDEVIGTSVYNYAPQDFHKIATDSFEQVIETEKPTSYTTEYDTPDGDIHFFDVRVGPVFESGKVIALISTSCDVTDRKKAEEELIEVKDKIILKMGEHDDYIRDIGDKLRNPLLVLKGSLEMFDHKNLDDEQKEKLERIKKSYDALEEGIKKLT